MAIDKGPEKVGEEMTECILAAKNSSSERTVEGAAELLFSIVLILLNVYGGFFRRRNWSLGISFIFFVPVLISVSFVVIRFARSC
ncbi:hypothetical protein [Methanogenium sp. MK-MG]|uniref:hypothetical protein n=1 Tax=Methanogenium sp. MK-MG TaxID=2599926 RepID=UPI0013ECDD3C